MERARRLACWTDKVELEALAGGLTNTNFLAHCGGEKYFVRVAGDESHHNIIRAFEVEASKAAHAAGLAPEVIHSEFGVLVIGFIEGATLSEDDLSDYRELKRIVAMVRHCHDVMANYWRGAIPSVWPFHIVRNYARLLKEQGHGSVEQWQRLLEVNSQLEAIVGPTKPVVTHNDLLAANFIDDGNRLWLIDWEYSGFGAALSDLAFLSANNRLTPAQDDWLLEYYFSQSVTDQLRRQYQAMLCVSALREAAWSMVQESGARRDHDFSAYSARCLRCFEVALSRFRGM